MSSISKADVAYRERLLPKLWVWIAAAGVVIALAVAYGYGLGLTGGLVTLAVGLGVAAGVLVATAPRIEVSATTFRAGRANLPTEWIGKVSALDQRLSNAALTEQADPTAFLMIRPLAAPRVVLVEVTDPVDPHPYWLVSSRRPDRLAHALITVRPSVRQSA